MKAKLSPESTKRVVEFYFANGKSHTRAMRQFNEWAASNNIATRVTRKNVFDTMKRFENATTAKPARYKKTLDEEILIGVISSLYQQPDSSIRKCAEDMDLSVGTTHTIARRVLKLYPYRLLLTQKLSEFDKIVRVEACRRLLDIVTPEKRIVFSDECSFYTDGHVNRWNCRLWDWERPEEFYAETSQSAKHVTVWGGMAQGHLYGPYFFPATVTGDSYRAILTEFFIPDMQETLGGLGDVWFHQDGAPAHVATETKFLLSSVFDSRVISRDFPCEWPPRSPDLTPCDYYLWGVVKDIVYRERRVFDNVADLQDAIIQAFRMIREDKMDDLTRAVQAVPSRLEMCVSLCGSQLLHC